MRNSALKQLVESIERLEADRDEIATQIREKKAEAVGFGYSRKALNVVLKRRKMGKDELDALVDLYQAELGMLAGTPLGDAAIARLERLDRRNEQNPAEAEAPPPPEPEAPADTEDEAREKGAAAACAGEPITANPYPPRSALRAAWDEAWCQEKGSDGMDLPDAWKPTPKKPKPSADDAAGAGEGGDGPE